jgi:hypothetical protein
MSSECLLIYTKFAYPIKFDIVRMLIFHISMHMCSKYIESRFYVLYYTMGVSMSKLTEIFSTLSHLQLQFKEKYNSSTFL